MRKLSVLFLALAGISTHANADINYLLNSSFNNDGTTINLYTAIETDGTIGIITNHDILSYSFIATMTIPDGTFVSLSFPPQDTTLVLTGDDLTATGRNLLFNYGANDGGVFSITLKTESAGPDVWCNASQGQDACAQGMSISAPPVAYGDVPLNSNVVLGTAPEMPTWAMLLVGLGGLGLYSHRSSRSSPVKRANG